MLCSFYAPVVLLCSFAQTYECLQRMFAVGYEHFHLANFAAGSGKLSSHPADTGVNIVVELGHVMRRQTQSSRSSRNS